jgi:hypothetical protein
MATQVKPTTKNSPKIVTGTSKGKENKPASAYVDRAKEGLSQLASRPDQSDPASVNMSVGNVYRRPQPEAKTSGIKMRGTGAATKGVMSRGPMG